MTLNYEISLGDLIAFQAHYMGNDRKVSSITRYVIFGFAAFIIVLVGTKTAISGEIDAADLGFLVFFGILLCLYNRFLGKTTLSIAKKLYDQPGNSSLMGFKTLVLDEKGVSMSDEWKQTSWRWDGLWKAGETPDHYFLYDSAISAVIVPKRDLDSGDLDAIRAILQGHGLLA